MIWKSRFAKLSRFFSAQILVQGVGFVVGILLVRAMTKEEFALYSICVSVTAAGVALSEGGVTGVLMSEGPNFGVRRARFATLLHGAVRFRRIIAVFMLAPSSVLLFIMLARNGATPLLAIWSIVIVVLTMWFSLERGLLQVPLRLDAQYVRIQYASLLAACLRLVLVGVLFATQSVGVWEALSVVAVSTILEIWVLRRSLRSLPAANPHQRLQSVVKSRLMLALGRTMPATITAVLQGQAFLLILSFSSSTEVIAELSALARFSVVYVVFNAFFLDVISGRFARATSARRHLARGVTSALLGYLGIVAIVVAAMSVFSVPVLAVLGPDYSGLEIELVIVSLGSGLIALGNAWRNLNFARNWVRGSWLFVPSTMVWVLIGIFALDLSNIYAAAWWMAAQACAALVTQCYCTYLGIREAAPR